MMEKYNIYKLNQFTVPTIHIFEDSPSASTISSPKSIISSMRRENNISLSMYTISNRSSVQNIPIFEENIVLKSPSSIQSDYLFDFYSIASSIQEDDSIFHNIFQEDIYDKTEVAENTYKK